MSSKPVKEKYPFEYSPERKAELLAAAAPEMLACLRSCAFALESVAHLRGLERELLPYADAAREIIAKAEGL